MLAWSADLSSVCRAVKPACGGPLASVACTLCGLTPSTKLCEVDQLLTHSNLCKLVCGHFALCLATLCFVLRDECESDVACFSQTQTRDSMYQNHADSLTEPPLARCLDRMQRAATGQGWRS